MRSRRSRAKRGGVGRAGLLAVALALASHGSVRAQAAAPPRDGVRTVRVVSQRRVLSSLGSPTWFAEVQPDGTSRFLKAAGSGGLQAGGPANFEAELVAQQVLERLGILTPRVEVVRVEGRPGLFLLAERFDRPDFLRGRTLVSPLSEPGAAVIDWEQVRRLALADLILGNWDRLPRNLRFVSEGASAAPPRVRPLAYDHGVALLTASVTRQRSHQLPLDGSLAGPPALGESFRPWDYWKILQANGYFTAVLGAKDAGPRLLQTATEVAGLLDDATLERLVRSIPDAAITGADPEARRREVLELLRARRDRSLELMRSASRSSPRALARYRDQVPRPVRAALGLGPMEVPAFLEQVLARGAPDPTEAYRQLRMHGVGAHRALGLVTQWAAAAGVPVDTAQLHATESVLGGAGATRRLHRPAMRDRIGPLVARMTATSTRFVAAFGAALGRAGLNQLQGQAPLLAAVYLFHVIERTAAGRPLEAALVEAAPRAFTPEFLAGVGGFVVGAMPLDMLAAGLQRAAILAGQSALRASALGLGALTGGVAASSVQVLGENRRDRRALEAAAAPLDSEERDALLALSQELLGPELTDVLREALMPERLSPTRLLVETAGVAAVGLVLLASTGVGFVAVAGAVLAGFGIHALVDAVSQAWSDMTFDPVGQRGDDLERVERLLGRIRGLITARDFRGAHLAVRAEWRLLRERVLADMTRFQEAHRGVLELAQATALHALGRDGLRPVHEELRLAAWRSGDPARRAAAASRFAETTHPSFSAFANLDHFHRLHHLHQAGARSLAQEKDWPCGYTHRSWLPRLATELGEGLRLLADAEARLASLPVESFARSQPAAWRLERLAMLRQRADSGLQALHGLGELADGIDAAWLEVGEAPGVERLGRVLDLHAAVRDQELAELLAVQAQQGEVLRAGLGGVDLQGHALRLWGDALAALGLAGSPHAGPVESLLDRRPPAPAAAGCARSRASGTAPSEPSPAAADGPGGDRLFGL